jgi:hypothetical protein
MGIEFFPQHMYHYEASENAGALKVLRIIFAVVTIVVFGLDLLESFDFYKSLYGFALFLNLLFFVWASLGYFVEALRINKILCLLFLTIWALDWTLVIVDQYIEPLLLDYYLWLITALVLVDYVFNRISFVRIQYIVPAIVIVVYFVIENIVIFISGFWDFDDLVELIIGLVVAVVVLEIGRFIKVRKCKDHEHEHSLI